MAGFCMSENSGGRGDIATNLHKHQEQRQSPVPQPQSFHLSHKDHNKNAIGIISILTAYLGARTIIARLQLTS